MAANKLVKMAAKEAADAVFQAHQSINAAIDSIDRVIQMLVDEPMPNNSEDAIKELKDDVKKRAIIAENELQQAREWIDGIEKAVTDED